MGLRLPRPSRIPSSGIDWDQAFQWPCGHQGWPSVLTPGRRKAECSPRAAAIHGGSQGPAAASPQWPRAELLWGFGQEPPEVTSRLWSCEPMARTGCPVHPSLSPLSVSPIFDTSWLPALVQSHFPAGYVIQEQDPGAGHASSFLTLTQPVTYQELRTVHPFSFHEWNTTFHGFTALSHDQT